MRWLYYLLMATMLSACTIGTEVHYSDVSLTFFLDTWWSIDHNKYFDDGTCFLLKTEDNTLRILDPIDGVEYVSTATWEIIDDYIFVDGTGFELEISPYGTCGDYSVRISSDFSTQESSLYECDF